MSVQKAKLDTILTVSMDVNAPINIVSDSQYAVKVTSQIDYNPYVQSNNTSNILKITISNK